MLHSATRFMKPAMCWGRRLMEAEDEESRVAVEGEEEAKARGAEVAEDAVL